MSVLVDIHKDYGRFRLDVKFEAGNEAVALLGASGSGKSLTLRCIAGIDKPDSGKIIVDGVTFFDSDKRINLPVQQRRVGLLFQNYALFPNMTVRQNILSGMTALKLTPTQKEERIAELVSALFLNGLEHSRPAQLSGGQQQRTALARILASEPRVILLDEPFSALDSYLRWQMEQEIGAVLARFSGTALMVSHNRDEVYRMCDKIAVLDCGRVRSVAEKWELFKNPQTYAGALLTGCKNIAPAKRLSPHKVYIPSWGIALRTSAGVPDDLAFVGVRAHRITVGIAGGENTFSAITERAIRDTFSRILMLRPLCGNALIRWEISGENTVPDESELNVFIPPEEILLLTE